MIAMLPNMGEEDMKVLIIGAAGMVGAKLAQSLTTDPEPGLDGLVLVDVVPPKAPAGATVPVETGTLDMTDAAAVAAQIAARPDVIFHLAAVVSGEAEADFEKGYAVNFDGTRNLLEAIRGLPGYKPRVIFASSIAVFGTPFPDPITDTYILAPLTSYGTQKAMGELLINDYSRRGFIDGVGLRLPTICIRPGTPNKAASGFFSNILREPLAGKEAVLPVSEDVRHWHASPRAAIGFLRHAMTLDTGKLGARRCLTMPGLSATVGEQIQALRRAAGDATVALIRREPDPVIIGIVAGWPTRFDAARAEELGFRAESSFDEIIAAHVADELGGKIAPRG
jgi:D-erythronate 2-dehydrogenase